MIQQHVMNLMQQGARPPGVNPYAQNIIPQNRLAMSMGGGWPQQQSPQQTWFSHLPPDDQSKMMRSPVWGPMVQQMFAPQPQHQQNVTGTYHSRGEPSMPTPTTPHQGVAPMLPTGPHQGPAPVNRLAGFA